MQPHCRLDDGEAASVIDGPRSLPFAALAEQQGGSPRVPSNPLETEDVQSEPSQEPAIADRRAASASRELYRFRQGREQACEGVGADRNLQEALPDVLAVARQDRGKSRAIDNFEPHTRGPCLVPETRKIGFFYRAIRAQKDPVGRGTLTANRPEVASELSCCVARLGRIFDGDGRFAGSQTDEGIRYASARLAFAG